MSKLTDKQIQWIWEQCGLTFAIDSDGTVSSYDPDGNFICFGYLPIDLNNLFKYAVPKLKSCELAKHDRRDLDGWFATVRIKEKTGFINHQDPALALFWAIYKAFGGRHVEANNYR